MHSLYPAPYTTHSFKIILVNHFSCSGLLTWFANSHLQSKLHLYNTIQTLDNVRSRKLKELIRITLHPTDHARLKELIRITLHPTDHSRLKAWILTNLSKGSVQENLKEFEIFSLSSQCFTEEYLRQTTCYGTQKSQTYNLKPVRTLLKNTLILC